MKKPKLLLIDDNDELRLILKLYLERHGFEVLAEADASSAWNRLRGETGSWIILTDNQMPGLSGLEFLERFCLLDSLTRPSLGPIGAVLMSGDLPPAQMVTVADRLIAAGVGFEFIAKPFEVDVLMPCLERLICRAQCKEAQV